MFITNALLILRFQVVSYWRFNLITLLFTSRDLCNLRGPVPWFRRDFQLVFPRRDANWRFSALSLCRAVYTLVVPHTGLKPRTQSDGRMAVRLVVPLTASCPVITTRAMCPGAVQTACAHSAHGVEWGARHGYFHGRGKSRRSPTAQDTQ